MADSALPSQRHQVALSYLLDLLAPLDRFLEARRKVDKRRALGPVERRLAADAAMAFRQQGELFTGKLAAIKGQFPQPAVQEADGAPDWEPLLDQVLGGTTGLLLTPIQAAAGEAMTAGADALLASLGEIALGYSFDLKNPRAVEYLGAHCADMVTKVNDTTRAEIKRIVTDGIANGRSYDDIARDITAKFEEFAAGRPQAHIDSRAHLVAVQEAGEAYEHGNYSQAQDLAAAIGPMEKSWSTMGDGRVSALCRGNEAAGWIPMDRPFPSGHMRPLGHVACRCDAYYRRAEA